MDAIAQPDGVARRMAAAVVVEIGEDVRPAGARIRQPVRPLVKPLIGVTPRIFARAVMKPHVDERSDDHPLRGRSLHVVQTQGDVVLLEQRVDAVVVPTGLAKFDGMAISRAAGRAENVRGGRDPASTPRRQLIQHRPERGPQEPARLWEIGRVDVPAPVCTASPNIRSGSAEVNPYRASIYRRRTVR